VFFVLVVISGPLMWRSISRQLPWAICRRLRTGESSIVRHSSYTAGVWDPSKPLGRGNSTPNVPGWAATYSLTDDGLVRLDLLHADGRHEQRIGPPVDAPDGFQRTIKIGLLPSVCYLLGIGAGGGGGLLAGGLTAAVLGAILGFVVTWFGLTVFAARWRARNVPPHDSKPSTTSE
jgi:hypothetical protein